jgi:hypothetical protein
LLQGDSVTQFNRVVELSKLIQQARFQVRGYTYSGKVDAEQPALDAIDNALKKITELKANCPPSTRPTCNRPASRCKPTVPPSASTVIPRLPPPRHSRP